MIHAGFWQDMGFTLPGISSRLFHSRVILIIWFAPRKIFMPCILSPDHTPGDKPADIMGKTKHLQVLSIKPAPRSDTLKMEGHIHLIVVMRDKDCLTIRIRRQNSGEGQFLCRPPKTWIL